jgi:uncharacterized membrane protein YfcA
MEQGEPMAPSPPLRMGWILLVGVLILFPLGGLVLLVIPQPLKAVLLVLLAIILVLLLWRLARLSSRRGQKRDGRRTV